MQEEKRLARAFVHVVDARSAREIEELMIGVEHRARDLESETLGAGRRDSFARERKGDTGDLEDAEDNDRDRAGARTSRAIDEPRDEQGYRDSHAEHGGKGGGGEAGRARRGHPKENDGREPEKNSQKRRARPPGTFGEGAVQKRCRDRNQNARGRDDREPKLGEEADAASVRHGFDGDNGQQDDGNGRGPS